MVCIMFFDSAQAIRRRGASAKVSDSSLAIRMSLIDAKSFDRPVSSLLTICFSVIGEPADFTLCAWRDTSAVYCMSERFALSWDN